MSSKPGIASDSELQPIGRKLNGKITSHIFNVARKVKIFLICNIGHCLPIKLRAYKSGIKGVHSTRPGSRRGQGEPISSRTPK